MPIKISICEDDSAGIFGYVLSAALAFTSGIFVKGCNINIDKYDPEMYSMSNTRIIKREIGNECNGYREMYFLQIDKKKMYIPKTDGNGNIVNLLRVDELTSYIESKRNFVEGLEFVLTENEKMRIDTKALD